MKFAANWADLLEIRVKAFQKQPSTEAFPSLQFQLKDLYQLEVGNTQSSWIQLAIPSCTQSSWDLPTRIARLRGREPHLRVGKQRRCRHCATATPQGQSCNGSSENRNGQLLTGATAVSWMRAYVEEMRKFYMYININK